MPQPSVPDSSTPPPATVPGAPAGAGGRQAHLMRIRWGLAVALVGLAEDSPSRRQTCIDVLCAYLRNPYTPPSDDTDDQAAERAGVTDRAEWTKLQTQRREEQQVRHTLIRLIGAHLRDDVP